MTNKHIARLLRETSALIELTGGNTFRARAFDRAARTIDRLDEPVTEHLAAGTLTDVPGIGAGLAADIQTLVATGSFALLDDLLASLPPGLLDLLRIKGLGAKRARQLWKELGITDLDALEHAAERGWVAELDGFGAKTQANILANLRLHRTYQQRRRYADAWHATALLLDSLRALPALHRVEPTGALRRKLETIERVDLIATTDDTARALDALASTLEGSAIKTDEATVFESTLPDGLPLRVFLVAPEAFGTAWWRTTGAEAHCEALAERFGPPEALADEAALFSGAGLPFIEPELREGDGELEAAANDALPRLITVEDLRGSLHNHSTYSDGAHTLRQMANHARSMGLSYFGICDHSQSLQIANGMPIDRVRAQQDEIRQLNAELQKIGGPPFRIFSGIESDILADGALDYPDDVLATFDFVVASVHTRFNMTEQEATERVLRAIANPYTSILGHPTGRLLLAREGYPLDHDAVIAACATHGVAIELNANPYRLDIDWRWLRKATDQGVLISINPDAHAMDQLDHVRWGVAVARKGWLTAEQCLNAKPLDAFATWIDARKQAIVA